MEENAVGSAGRSGQRCGCADVDLVIQMNPPKDPETYIHRSGRTGRAGATGVCITLCSRSREDRVPYIEKQAGFTFERIGPPQPKEMAAIAAGIAAGKVAAVQNSVVPWFVAAARQLLESEGSAEAALAKALAQSTGEPLPCAAAGVAAGVPPCMYSQRASGRSHSPLAEGCCEASCRSSRSSMMLGVSFVASCIQQCAVWGWRMGNRGGAMESCVAAQCRSGGECRCAHACGISGTCTV